MSPKNTAAVELGDTPTSEINPPNNAVTMSAPEGAPGPGSFSSPTPGWVQVQGNDKNNIFSCVQFGKTFGEIQSLDLGRECDELLKQGDHNQLIALILSNFRYTMSISVLLDADAPIPGPGDEITFPVEGIKGRVGAKVTIASKNNDVQTISFDATSFDSFNNQGAGAATRFSGAISTT